MVGLHMPGEGFLRLPLLKHTYEIGIGQIGVELVEQTPVFGLGGFCHVKRQLDGLVTAFGLDRNSP